MTEKLIETVTLLNKSEQLVYRLHINMDAVSPSDLTEASGWGTPGPGFPQEIKDAYDKEEQVLNSKAALQELISRAEKLVQSNYTPTTWTAFNTKLTAAKAVVAKANPTAAEIATAKTELETAMAGLVSTANRTALAAEIAKVEALNSADYTSATWAALQAELTKAKAVNDDKTTLQPEVDAALAALKEKITALQPSNLATAIQQLKDAVANAKTEIASGKYESAGVTALQTIVNNAEALIASNPTNVSDVNNMISNINGGISNLVEKESVIPGLTEPEVGKRFNMNGIDYTIVAKENDKFLVLTDRLTKAQLKPMGFTASSENKLAYTKISGGNEYGDGYDSSQLKQIDQAFYETYVEGTDYDTLVQKISFKKEVGTTNWDTRTDGPTQVNNAGTKTAFSLSVSDINIYNLKDYFKDTTGSGSVWLRSPGFNERSATVMSHAGTFGYNEVKNESNVRISMWLELGQ